MIDNQHEGKGGHRKSTSNSNTNSGQKANSPSSRWDEQSAIVEQKDLTNMAEV